MFEKGGKAVPGQQLGEHHEHLRNSARELERSREAV